MNKEVIEKMKTFITMDCEQYMLTNNYVRSQDKMIEMARSAHESCHSLGSPSTFNEERERGIMDKGWRDKGHKNFVVLLKNMIKKA